MKRKRNFKDFMYVLVEENLYKVLYKRIKFKLYWVKGSTPIFPKSLFAQRFNVQIHAHIYINVSISVYINTHI